MKEKNFGAFFVKRDSEIALMEESCRILGETFRVIKNYIKPGIETIELDKIAEDFIRSNNAKPAFKGYEVDDKFFPNTLCISIDEEVIHGLPGSRKLKEGEIVSVDCGVEKNGYFGDAAYTFPVGEISEFKRRLMRVTKEALMLGIEQAVTRNKLYDISRTIQTHCERHGYNVTRELIGHGIGKALHEDPPVPNYVPPLLYRNKYPNIKLQRGMTIAIEPMVLAGTKDVRTKSDGWTVITADRKPAAHFEHTVVIDDGKPVILTMWE
ncbi:MAG: Methionine aminopeptidase [Bacteroidota bacterium]|nr:Methionine aminopeptidase [Bacteroidota bacterium]